MSQPRILNKNRLLVFKTVTRLTNSFIDNEKLKLSLHMVKKGVSRIAESLLGRCRRSEVKDFCFKSSDQTQF